MRIVIESKPLADMRYDTWGDWQWLPGGTLHVTVADPCPPNSAWLVGTHEMIEAWLCRAVGITEQQVDDFDMNYTGDGDAGDDPASPYHKQHCIAAGIERMLCAALDIPWAVHDGAAPKGENHVAKTPDLVA